MLRRAAPLAILVALLASVAPAAGADRGVTAYQRAGGGMQQCAEPFLLGLPVRGGCLIKAKAGPKDLRFTVVTPFGAMKFADCGYTYTVHVHPEGYVWLGFLRSDGGNPCGDMQPCIAEGAGIQRPWNGRIRLDEDGGYYLDLDTCFDTCMGLFEGKTRFELVRVDGDWRIRADRALVGDSGLEIDGDWKTRSRGFEVRPAPKSD